jgi:hypothetical protein
VIASQTTRGGLAEILGKSGNTNIQGEEVMKLDELADRMVSRLNDHTGRLAVMASEEHAGLLNIPEHYSTGKYVLLYDPLDGSSNIDFNIPVGTIFSIYHRKSLEGPGTMEDCLPRSSWSRRDTLSMARAQCWCIPPGTACMDLLDPSVGNSCFRIRIYGFPENPCTSAPTWVTNVIGAMA